MFSILSTVPVDLLLLFVGNVTFSFAKNSTMQVSGSLGTDEASVVTIVVEGDPKTDEYFAITGPVVLKGYELMITQLRF